MRSGRRLLLRYCRCVVILIEAGAPEIDTLLGGWERVTAGYLIEGPAPVLVETGSQTSVPAVLAALEDLGVGPGYLAGLADTHIQLHHARGDRDRSQAFPEAHEHRPARGDRPLHYTTHLGA